MKREELFFPVEMVDTEGILGHFPNGMAIVAPKHQKAIVATVDGQPKIVNFPSAGYGLIPMIDILVPFEEELIKEFQFEATYLVREDSKFAVTYILEGRNLLIGKTKFNDELKPQIKLFHSYDSSTIFHLMFGYWRKVCTNGLMGWMNESNLAISHTSEEVKMLIPLCMDAIRNFAEKSKDFSQVYEDLTDRMIVKWEDRVVEVMEATNQMKSYKNDIIERINFEHSSNKITITDWLIYNAFNYQINHKSEAQELDKIKKDQIIFNYIKETHNS